MNTEKDPKFEALLDYLKRSRGFDFSSYKRSSLMRRVTKRMQAVDTDVRDYLGYMDYLEVHPEEFIQLFNTILINVTGFFRDEAPWNYLAREIIPQILKGKSADDPIRIWNAGCSSGEETYTLAMLFAEALGHDAFCGRVKIYSTDVDEEALAQARSAAYTNKELQPIPAAMRRKYFETAGGRHTFRTELRRSVIFGRHDLLSDAPISRLDLLVCRNTLMYFNAEAQARVLARFHFALHDGGVLFLGRAEMLLSHPTLFTPVDLRHRVFIKTSRVPLRDRLLVLAQVGDLEAANHLTRHERLREAAFDMAMAAQLGVDQEGKLALANESARLLFNLTNKDLGRPLQDLELSYRPTDLRSLMDQAYAERRMVTQTSVERHVENGDTQYYDVRVTPLYDNGTKCLGASVIFNDVTVRQRLQNDLQRTTQELETMNEELQSAHEELETTNEELQSTNEELETTNEELQSSNEELETMNEELQSTNEELQTMNTELRQRTEALDATNAFLNAILGSMRRGVVVVDRQLNVRAWNRQSEDLWGLRVDEVLGHSLVSLDIGLPVEQLPIGTFLGGKLESKELKIPATNRRGRAILCNVIMTPYINTEGERAGVVLTMEAENAQAEDDGLDRGIRGNS